MGQRYRFDDTFWRKQLEDFDNFEADQWIITEVGSGTRAVAAADGGILVITNAAADDDHNYLQYSGDDNAGVAEAWTFTPGKKMYFAARFKVSDATQSDFAVGLQITDTSPLASADGIWFQKDDGDAFLDFHAAIASTQTNALALHTVVDDTYLKVAWYYDGVGTRFKLLVDDVIVGSAVITNAPTTELALSVAFQNGVAVAKVMSLDFLYVCKER